jgi:PKD repeat protein
MIIQGPKITTYNTSDWNIKSKVIIPDTIFSIIKKGWDEVETCYDASTGSDRLFIIKQNPQDYHRHTLLTYSMPDFSLLDSRELTYDDGTGNYSCPMQVSSITMLFGDSCIIFKYSDTHNTRDGYIYTDEGRITGRNADDSRYVVYEEIFRYSKYGNNYQENSGIIDNYGKWVGYLGNDDYHFSSVTIDSNDDYIVFYNNSMISIDKNTHDENITRLIDADGYYFTTDSSEIILLDDLNLFVKYNGNSLLFFDSKSFFIYDEYKKDTLITSYYYNKKDSSIILTDSDGNIDVLKMDNFSALSAEFLADKDSINQFNYVFFSPKYNNPNATYHWEFGDGSTSNEIKPTHQYITSGSYSVKLTVKLNDSITSINKLNYITVIALDLRSDSIIKLLWGRNTDLTLNPNWFRYADDGKSIVLANDKSDIVIISSQTGDNIYSENLNKEYRLITSANNDNLFIITEPELDNNDLYFSLSIQQKSIPSNLGDSSQKIEGIFCELSPVHRTSSTLTYFLMPNEPILIIAHNMSCSNNYNGFQRKQQIYLYDYLSKKFVDKIDGSLLYKLFNSSYIMYLNSYNEYNNTMLFGSNGLFKLDLKTKEKRIFSGKDIIISSIAYSNEIEFLGKSGDLLLTNNKLNLHNLYFYDSNLDSIFLEKQFNSNIVKMVYKPNNKYTVFMVFEDGLFVLYSLSTHSVIDSIKFTVKFVEICVSPSGNEFSLLTEEGIIYSFEYKESQIKSDSSVYSIYPNPATDFIEISYTSSELDISVRIYDLLGIEQLTLTPNSDPWKETSSVRIDVSSLPPGIYFVRVGDIVRKFIKM